MDLPAHRVIATVGGTPVYQFDNTSVVGWVSGMNVDADGSPHAYSPNGSPPGLDYLANAGGPGNWWGIVTDNNQSSGRPVIQDAGDPAPGFYVSCTSLQNPAYDYRSPLAWVDSETIPFIVLPGGHKFSGKMGDVATVVHLSSGIYCHAIAADIGPSDQIGEGSIALAKALGIPSSPKHGGADSGIGFLLYPDSGNGRPLTVDQINALAGPLFEKAVGAGHVEQLKQASEESSSSIPPPPPPRPAVPLIVFNSSAASPHGVPYQKFLNQFPGCALRTDGVLGSDASAATAKVLGFRLSGDPQAGAPAAGPYVVYDAKNLTDYTKLLEAFLSTLPGISLGVDGYAGEATSDAVMQVFGHRLIDDPRDGAPSVPPTIPFDPHHFSSYAAGLQEWLATIPGVNLKPDGYAGQSTCDALRKVIGAGLPEEPGA